VPCPLLGSLVLSRGLCQQPRGARARSQALPVQLMLDQRRRLPTVEAVASSSCLYKGSGYQRHHVGVDQQRVSTQEAESEKEERKMWLGVGVGVGMGRPAQPPYVSWNLHQVLSGRSSSSSSSSTLKASPYAALGHFADGYGCHGNDVVSYSAKSQSPTLSPAQGGPREMPHYIGTSVIITNER